MLSVVLRKGCGGPHSLHGVRAAWVTACTTNAEHRFRLLSFLVKVKTLFVFLSQ